MVITAGNRLPWGKLSVHGSLWTEKFAWDNRRRQRVGSVVQTGSVRGKTRRLCNDKRKWNGADGIASLEVKFYDCRRTNKCESIQPVHLRRSRTKWGGLKMIRYRRNPSSKRWRLRIGSIEVWTVLVRPGTFFPREIAKYSCLQGEYGRKTET